MGKDSGSPPPAPDYTGAANATAQGNLEAARYATQANRVNQYTPYGSLTYQQGGGNTRSFDQAGYDKALKAYNDSLTQSGSPTYGTDPMTGMQYVTSYGNNGASVAKPNEADYWTTGSNPDQWSSTISLTPIGQQLLDQQNQLSTGLFGAQNTALNQVQGQGPMDLSSVNDVANRAYANLTARLDPQWAQNTTSQETKLTNQGLRPGDEAYDNAMRVFNQGKNDAYQQANLAAINTMPQTYTLAQGLYNEPLNRLNALRTGSQVTNPNFPQVPQQQTTTGPNLLGAVQSQGQYDQGLYNAQVAQNNSSQNSMMQAAALAAMLLV